MSKDKTFEPISFVNDADDEKLLQASLNNFDERHFNAEKLNSNDSSNSNLEFTNSPKRKKSPKKSRQQPRKIAGHISPDETIDLHGKTREEAIMMVANFISDSIKNDFENLLIITGWGMHSGQVGGVLNKSVNHWLLKNKEPHIKQISQAPQHYGGKGAIWVQLK